VIATGGLGTDRRPEERWLDGIKMHSSAQITNRASPIRLLLQGHELAVPLLALMQWGDRHLSEKPPRVARRRSDRSRINAILVAKDGEAVRPVDVEVVPRPGLTSS
jgi:hypothetical protein